MNLRDLRYLVAVADKRHFGQAAAACFVSQPTLSTQLRKLEETLEVQLVERSSRQVRLTPMGEAVAARAREILRLSSDLVDFARSQGDPLAGELRLGLLPTIAPYLLPHLVPMMRAELPRLRVSLIEEQTRDCLTGLAAGTIDAAMVALPVEGADRYAGTFLYREPFVLALPAGRQHEGRLEPVTADLATLADQPILLLEEGHCLRDQALDVCALAGAREASGFRATSLETLRQLVVAGVGITLLPALAAELSRSNAEAIELRRFHAPEPYRDIHLIWRRAYAGAPALERLVQLVQSLPAVRRLGDVRDDAVNG